MRMSMSLSIKERFAILSILPVEGSYEDLKALREIKEHLAMTEEEKTEIDWNTFPNGTAAWDDAKEKPLAAVFEESKVNIIKKQLNGLNSKNKLTDQHMDIYEKFIIENNVSLLPNVEEVSTE